MCNEGKTGICLNVNPARAGAAYGYVDMGGWVGGQAEYVMIPFADFNLLRFPDRDQALEKILDLTMLSDIFPTGYHGAYTAGVDHRLHGVRRRRRAGGPGRGVLRAAARRIDGHRRRHERRPARAGRELRLRDRGPVARATTLADIIADILGEPDGRRRRRCGRLRGSRARRRTPSEAPATVLNDIMDVARAGASLGIPGLYVTGDPGAVATTPRRRARSACGSVSAGRSRTRSSPASAR